MRPETWPAILISAARRSPIRARHGRHPDQAPNRMQNGGSVSVLLDFPVTQRDVEASMPLGQRQDDPV
jgi:hypothetical protein